MGETDPAGAPIPFRAAGALFPSITKAHGGVPWALDQVLRMNFSLHLGQVMAILPFPLGTRTDWRHLGQLKYLWSDRKSVV